MEDKLERTYKDRLFRMIFREKECLLSLYNAVNGTEEQPERQVLRLSDAFEKPMEEPELELKVLMLNINPGKNDMLLKRCRQLQDYMQYVSRVRRYARNMGIRDAVERTVEECIREGILKDFLQKYRAEAIQVSIFEYDEEKEMKKIREAEYREGERRGIEQGIHALIKTCKEFGISKRDVTDRLMQEFSISEKKAESYVDRYWQ